GAEGAQIGTRLIATTECAVHDRYKRAIVEAGDEATLVTGVRLGPSRVLRNPLAEDIRRMDDAGHSAEEIHAFIGHGRVRRAACEGDMDLGSAAAGQGAALCDDVRPIADIIGDMMRDAKRCLESGQVRLGTG
ncbi:nitronate monooxygenase, partial [bacterium]|nr:nitronate monooxygenase [bacterium]